VLVLSTSYPRGEGDVAGRFVAAQVEHVRRAGVDAKVVSPADFPHFGIAHGHGIVQNLRARPWLAPLVPAFLGSYARAARRASRGVDVVHAHWIPSGLAALATGKPYVLQVWGTDVELARRAPWLARPIVRRARLVVAASAFLADAARGVGAREVRVVPPGVEIPEHVAEPDEPPHVLYVGRLSEEKGVLEFLEATEGLPRAIVGDGPLRARVPEAVGFVAPADVGRYYERAAVVCVPSRREGYGMAAREAMAWGRPVVATDVGGLADLAGPGVVVAPTGDISALRVAVARLLSDGQLRVEAGKAARSRAASSWSWQQTIAALLDAYAVATRARSAA
jgi:glycosyltransferase involved in cell wall biosynthesis